MLYASNNRIKDWAEVERLAALPLLEDLLLIGNPLYCEWRDNNALPQYRVEVGATCGGNWGSGNRSQGRGHQRQPACSVVTMATLQCTKCVSPPTLCCPRY